MRIAVVGATGMVGRKMIKVLKERNIHYDELLCVASESSAGKEINIEGHLYKMLSADEALAQHPHVALFSAGGTVSLDLAPKFANAGCKVIDNSSAWRMKNNIKLIVPEINGKLLSKDDMIIANPNCSTIQLVMVLAPLHKAYGLKRVIVSTYQSVSGSGKKGVDQLISERENQTPNLCYPHPIDLNCLPHGGDFTENNYTSEELKLTNESRKILEIPDLALSGTVVRVPVVGGHSESVNIEFEKGFSIKRIRDLLGSFPGIVVQDDPDNFIYPMPITAQDKNEVFVGRIRKDLSCRSAINLWIVSDNLRKGAATNAVQILEYLVEKELMNEK